MYQFNVIVKSNVDQKEIPFWRNSFDHLLMVMANKDIVYLMVLKLDMNPKQFLTCPALF